MSRKCFLVYLSKDKEGEAEKDKNTKTRTQCNEHLSCWLNADEVVTHLTNGQTNCSITFSLLFYPGSICYVIFTNHCYVLLLLGLGFWEYASMKHYSINRCSRVAQMSNGPSTTVTNLAETYSFPLFWGGNSPLSNMQP